MAIAQQLKNLGLDIPEAPVPVAAYVPAVRSGNLIYTAGQVPFVKGQLAFSGKVGSELTVEQGAEAAKICVLNALGAVRSLIGDLERVVRIVKLTGFVNCGSDFTEQAKVMNGASELLLALFGDKGKHARCALGANALPLNAAVELDLIVEVE
ncbi:MAG TPA: RidA family protein [bacterium]|nr:RidA family protein [bacterium]